MTEIRKIILVLDDREPTSDEIKSLVGIRRFGDIMLRRRLLSEHFRSALPAWAQDGLVHVRADEDLGILRARLETGEEDCAAFIVAGRAGFEEPDRLKQLVERLPYAEDDFTDRPYKPLLVFFHKAHRLIERWTALEAAPVHTWTQGWHDSLRVQSVRPLDLSRIRDFLSFACGATETRHFNKVDIDTYFYTKKSTDKLKILSEYSFYELVPESMRPWLIEPFDYTDHGDSASYKMLRYYLADAALQWVHGAFDAETFEVFVDRLLFFVDRRPRKPCSREQSAAIADELFVNKLQARVVQFLALDEGKRINKLVESANPALELNLQVERYLRLFRLSEKDFAGSELVVGHGDPCFSNILYDQQRYLLKLVDPKGAAGEDALWTHPLYDLCKISHSVLGDYDFINGGLYSVSLDDGNDMALRMRHTNHSALKSIFRSRLKMQGHDQNLVRLGEASLFLSMLPLHIDYPNKVIAFMIKAKHILDEVEHGPSH